MLITVNSHTYRLRFRHVDPLKDISPALRERARRRERDRRRTECDIVQLHPVLQGKGEQMGPAYTEVPYGQGQAQCSLKDTYSREEGRKKALEAALNHVEADQFLSGLPATVANNPDHPDFKAVKRAARLFKEQVWTAYHARHGAVPDVQLGHTGRQAIVLIRLGEEEGNLLNSYRAPLGANKLERAEAERKQAVYLSGLLVSKANRQQFQTVGS